VDGVLFASGGGSGSGFDNLLIFGDTTGHENTDVEITAMSFTVLDSLIDVNGDGITDDIDNCPTERRLSGEADAQGAISSGTVTRLTSTSVV